MDKQTAPGFTLLEMLIALGVFAVIGVMSSQILSGIVDLSETVRERADRLAELQRAMFIVGRDIEQLTRRPVRDAFGDPTAAVMIGDSPMIEFTRRGWQNPLHSPRTELQRIAYTVEEGTLIRLFWPVLDRGPDTEPIAQELLTGVQEVAFLAHDGTGEEYSYWPLDPSLSNDDNFLAGVEFRVAHDTFGQLDRLWSVAPPTDFLLERQRAVGLPGTENPDAGSDDDRDIDAEAES